MKLDAMFLSILSQKSIHVITQLAADRLIELSELGHLFFIPHFDETILSGLELMSTAEKPKQKNANGKPIDGDERLIAHQQAGYEPEHNAD
jgi:hypothetical protein